MLMLSIAMEGLNRKLPTSTVIPVLSPLMIEVISIELVVTVVARPLTP